MTISRRQLLYLQALLVMILVLFESIVDEFSLEDIFSLWYSVPIFVLAFVLHQSIEKWRFQVISMIVYVGILFLTILSLIHLLLFDSGFGFVETTISIVHVCSVFLNVLMMSFAILQFRQYIKWQRAASKSI